MRNEMRIKPLIHYEVMLSFGDVVDRFTADNYVRDGKDVIFYRTGNPIRSYIDCGSMRIIATPVDDDTKIPE